MGTARLRPHGVSMSYMYNGPSSASTSLNNYYFFYFFFSILF